MTLLQDEEASADLELLIKEARVRSRRRRARNAGILGALAALLAGGLILVGAFSRSGVPNGRPSVLGAAGSLRDKSWPSYFADFNMSAEGSSGLQIRNSTTGRLTDPAHDGYADPDLPTPNGALPNVLALAATGPNSFVVAYQTGSAKGTWTPSCATQLYNVRLNARGHVRSFPPIGDAIPGYVWSLAASAGGRTIAYAVQGRPCEKGSRGYLRVLDVATGRTRQWSDVELGGETVGNLDLGGLSMTADGRELVFAAAAGPPYKTITGYQVRLLTTDAAGGTLAARSRILLSDHYRAGYSSAVISPNGRSLYLCRGTPEGATSELVAYTMADMKPTATLARFPGDDNCAGSLDMSGRWLLIQYGLTAPPASPVPGGRPAWGARGMLHIARINTLTGARSDLTLWTQPGFGTMSPPTGMDAEW